MKKQGTDDTQELVSGKWYESYVEKTRILFKHKKVQNGIYYFYDSIYFFPNDEPVLNHQTCLEASGFTTGFIDANMNEVMQYFTMGGQSLPKQQPKINDQRVVVDDFHSSFLRLYNPLINLLRDKHDLTLSPKEERDIIKVCIEIATKNDIGTNIGGGEAFAKQADNTIEVKKPLEVAEWYYYSDKDNFFRRSNDLDFVLKESINNGTVYKATPIAIKVLKPFLEPINK
jgi:hypothetical protein